MRLDDAPFIRFLDVVTQEFCPPGSCLESKCLSEPLPHKPTVYLLTREGFITYVGQTQDLKVRMAQHAANPRMAVLGYDTINFIGGPGLDLDTRLQVEAMLICACLPPKNKAVMLVLTKQGRLREIKFGCKGALGRAVRSANREGDQPWSTQSGAMR